MVYPDILLVGWGSTLKRRGPFTGRAVNLIDLMKDEALEAIRGTLQSLPRLGFPCVRIGVLSETQSIDNYFVCSDA